MTDWDERFINLSKYIASWSKDRSTQVGAIIVGKNREVLSTGYNGFPRGVDDTIEERHERPLKYKWTEHAERNAIYNAARNGIQLEGSTIYLEWFPCCDCARAISQSGIAKLVCGKPDFEHERWGEDFKISNTILKLSGVKIKHLSMLPKK